MSTLLVADARDNSTRRTPFSIVPLPNRVVPGEGVFDLSSTTKIIAASSLMLEADALSTFLGRAIGGSCPVVPGSRMPAADAIVLRLLGERCGLGKEGYRLKVAPNAVTLDAATNAGIFYGIQTLLQLLPPAAFTGVPLAERIAIPCVDVDDAPRFPWRGALLDVARWYMPVDDILRFIDGIALHKLNTLHLHLNDDQGWRLEIRKYPKLTSVGSFRAQTVVGQVVKDPVDDGFESGMYEYDGKPHGGYYTQQEMRRIVRYAADRHINVVPEIDMPGHAQAAIAAYPELGCTGMSPGVSSNWGIHAYLFNPFETTISFLQDVLDEVLEIFPSEYIHVGGDEAVKMQWRDNEACQAYAKSLGLSTNEELQSHFIGTMSEYLAGRGRRLIGWDEILEGGLARNSVVMSWRGEEGGIEAAMAGHDVIMTPCQYTYLDYYQSANRKHEPMAFPHGCTPLSVVYHYEPVPAGLPADCTHHVLGSQGQLWTEYMPTSKHVEYMAFPRLCALAEVTWGKRDGGDFDAFLMRLGVHLQRLDGMRINYRPLDETDSDL